MRNDNLKVKTNVGHLQLNIYLDKINLMVTNRITDSSDKMYLDVNNLYNIYIFKFY